MLQQKTLKLLGVLVLTAVLAACGNTNSASQQAKDNEKNQKINAETAQAHAEELELAEETKLHQEQLATNDISYLTQLGEMQGHLLVGYELYLENSLKYAKEHMKHPEMELYADLVPAFKTRNVAGFAAELTTLSNSVNSNLPRAEIEAAYANVIAAIDKASLAVAEESKTAQQQLYWAGSLLQVAAQEYDIGIVDGEVSDILEYQDAYGFTKTCKKIVANIVASDEKTKKALATIQQSLDSLDTLWPELVPTAKLDSNAVPIYDAVLKINQLAEALAD